MHLAGVSLKYKDDGRWKLRIYGETVAPVGKGGDWKKKIPRMESNLQNISWMEVIEIIRNLSIFN